MNSAIGAGGVVLGLTASVLGLGYVALALRTRRDHLLRSARMFAFTAFGGAALAVAAMQRALITRDFTVQFVYDNGSSRTPPLFNVATMWSALEGSILLWVIVLTGYLVAVAHRYRHRLADPLVGWALMVIFGVCIFFFALLAGPADPFGRVDPAFGYDGPGPNPLLQNHILMAFHPPMLYLGYVGFTVPFAFAVGALVTGRVDAQRRGHLSGWLSETRRWTLFAWGFLTAGIVLGAWWSYEVLGWGGYWAWDPVENASLLPWLTGTAYIHSVMVQERRGMLRVWNLSLLCATFALTILGTFLTRSGILDSVHAFSDSPLGAWFLSFFAVVVVVTLGLIAWRGDELRAPGRIDSPVSREGSFLANNLLFAAFAFVVLLGTVFPLVVEAVNDDRLSVGAPYFDRMTIPLGLTILFLMAVAPLLPWRSASGELLAERVFWPAWAGAGALVAAVLVGARGLAPLTAFGLGGFAGGAALRQLALAVRRQGWRGLIGRTNGGMIVHLGVVVVAVALAASQSYASEAELTLEEGQSATVAGHELQYLGLVSDETDARTRFSARVRVDGERVFEPAVSQFTFGGQSVGTPSVRTSPVEDVYLAVLRLPDETGGPVVLRVVVQPLVVWLWVGGVVMAAGTFMAALPGRRRRPGEPEAERSAPRSQEPAREPVGVG